MLGSTQKVEITLDDTMMIESRLSRRKCIGKVPAEIRRAGAEAVCQYLAFRTRQPVGDRSAFIVEHIEVATH